METVIGVDASRNRSGGAIAHLLGMLGNGDPSAHGIGKVHIWSYRKLLDSLPDPPWLTKHNPPALECSLLHQAWWQYRLLPMEAVRLDCDVMFYTDAGALYNFHPAVVMSQDMLSYEPLEMKRHGLTAARARLILLRAVQTRSMKRADGVIFLTDYAATTIQRVTGELQRSCVIPHGIDAVFRRRTAGAVWPQEPFGTIRCLYISNALVYKHQWTVVRAVGDLRRRGHNLSLLLVGGGTGRARRRLDEEIARTDPHRDFVATLDFVRHENVPALLAGADLFVFASSCESMPVTLLEAMASGLPIACSNRGSMPEILKEGGVYFDPESPCSAARAIETILLDRDRRASIARRARELSEHYTWARCASETWQFLRASSQARQVSGDGRAAWARGP